MTFQTIRSHPPRRRRNGRRLRVMVCGFAFALLALLFWGVVFTVATAAFNFVARLVQ